jgi:hypothetical protein
MNPEGISTVRAWKRGVIESYLNQGLSLKEAMIEAERSVALVYENTVHNLVVDAGKELAGDLFINQETAGFTYHAIGTGATTPADSDSHLTTEVARKLWIAKTRTANTVYFSQFYLAAECTFNIKEAGVFGGAAASATPGSGRLFCHYLQPYDNSAGLVDLTFEYELEVD